MRLRFRSICLPILLLCACAALAAPATVYVKLPDGKWAKVEGQQADGKVSVRLGAQHAGSTQVVVNKPAWMVLEDEEPPKLAWVKMNGKEVKPAASIDLGTVSDFPLALSFGLKDNANPLDPAAATLSLDPPAKAQIDATQIGFPKANGKLTVTLPKLPAGQYAARLRVLDMSPQANALEVPISFTVRGVRVSADQQEITLVGGGGSYVFRAKPQDTLQTGNAAAAYLTVNINGEHMYLDKITGVETLEDKPGVQSIRVSGAVAKTDKGNDGTKLCRLEYDLTLRDDLPCLLVKSRTINLAGPRAALYCWWGWLPGAKYADAAGEHEWAMAYKDVGKVGWVYLASAKPEVNGIGWIGGGKFGESRFGTMLMYTIPQTIPTEMNASVEIPFALMPATKADEVAKAAAQIKALGLW
jgi:hypothetical protein